MRCEVVQQCIEAQRRVEEAAKAADVAAEGSRQVEAQSSREAKVDLHTVRSNENTHHKASNQDLIEEAVRCIAS
mgnify:CR=1 FL=1